MSTTPSHEDKLASEDVPVSGDARAAEKPDSLKQDEGHSSEGQTTDAGNPPERNATDNAVWSVWTPTQKKLIILAAGISSFFSPISAQIYFPALNTIAADLKVSNSLVNLTLTTYMVGLLPRHNKDGRGF